ncbi:hypothetical protein YC2023_079994 [Brassica napus]
MDELELPSGLFETGCEPTGKKRVNNYFNLRWIEVIKSALEDKVDLISKRFGFRYLCLGSCNPQLQIYCTNYIIASPQPHTSPNRVPVTKKSITGWNDGKKTVTTFFITWSDRINTNDFEDANRQNVTMVFATVLRRTILYPKPVNAVTHNISTI